jgi:hypothetical protein
MGYKFFAKMSERAYLYAPPLRTFWGVIPPAKKQRIAPAILIAWRSQ